MTQTEINTDRHARYAMGQIIHHRLFDYRGVIFEIDPAFMLTDEWYEQIAKSRPPKDEPWYHVMVDNAQHTTYVAEQNLESTDALQAIDHPAINNVFAGFSDGRYRLDNHHIQ